MGWGIGEMRQVHRTLASGRQIVKDIQAPSYLRDAMRLCIPEKEVNGSWRTLMSWVKEDRMPNGQHSMRR